ncbi:MAG: GNAT family N-acetyltransferase [Bacteroidales bacterium]|jgi:hypothetical protein|nr:GNAT family N-acetyltransferase [Bacteroidales bacterium]
MKDYTIEKVDVDDNSLMLVCGLLQTAFSKSIKFSFEYIQWQYRQNPIGKIVGYNAFARDGVLAAHYVAMPIVMTLFGERKKGLLSLNTATHPDHRGKKLFSILADRTYREAVENNFDFVIGVANANSTHGFLHNLGFYLIAPLNLRFGLGNNIFTKQAESFNCYRTWDEETLNWRLQSPKNKYSCRKNIFSSPISFFMKTLSCVEIPLKLPKTSRMLPLNLYVGLGADLQKGTYFRVPSFIKHSPFNLIFKDLTGKLPVIKKEDMFFQLIDFDVI